MELTSFWGSSVDGWFLLGIGLIQAVAAFCGIFLIDWSKNFRNIARYPKIARSLRFYPLEMLIVSWLGLAIGIMMAFKDGHPVVAVILIVLGTLQVLAVLIKRLYRPLKLSPPENLLEGDAKR